MAGSVSGSRVRTQKRFCGLWMGCTVGLGPAGERLGGELSVAWGVGALWWPAREKPGLDRGRVLLPEPTFPKYPLLLPVRDQGSSQKTETTNQERGLCIKAALLRSGCRGEGVLTMLCPGETIAGIISGDRYRLSAHFSVNVKFLGQGVDDHGQVLLTNLHSRKKEGP